MARILGIATIGQAPRDDLKALFATLAPAGAEVILRGCLDGLSDAEIDARTPLGGPDALYTRLRGGRDVKISKAAVIDRAPAALAALRADGAETIVFACTGEFPSIEGDSGVLFPSRVLNGLAQALLPEGRLGILIPLPEQAEELMAKWRRPGLEIVAEALRPSAGRQETGAAAERLAAHHPDLIAMDCMSYTPETKAIVKEVTGLPTLLGVTATGHVLREMLD